MNDFTTGTKVAALKQLIAKLRQQAGTLGFWRTQTGYSTPFQELEEALEELQAAEEELRQQNEELAASRQIIEAERKRY